MSVLSNPLVVSLIITLAGTVIHRAWSAINGKSDGKLDAAVASFRAIMNSLVASAAPNISLADLHEELVGAAAIQLARAGIDPQDPLVKALVDAAVTQCLGLFVAQHSDPQSLAPQVRAIVAARAPNAPPPAPSSSAPAAAAAVLLVLVMVAGAIGLQACSGAQRAEAKSAAACTFDDTSQIFNILDDSSTSPGQKLEKLAIVGAEVSACVIKQHAAASVGSGSAK